MGEEEAVEFLTREQARDLAALAEQAKQALGHFAGHNIAYDVEAIQLFDEWIEDYLEQAPNPRGETRLLWTSFLGEIFRRRHEGWWALRDGELVIVCPTEGKKQHIIDVEGQIDRRISAGMAESLTYFYNMALIELKMG